MIEWRVRTVEIDGAAVHLIEGEYRGRKYRHAARGGHAALCLEALNRFARKVEAEVAA